MSKVEIIQAWKDTQYRRQLSSEERLCLPEHPAGSIELTDADLDQIQAGIGSLLCLTAGCCETFYICGTLGGICTVIHYELMY